MADENIPSFATCLWIHYPARAAITAGDNPI